MPSLKFICLHGAGTNVEILSSQLDPLLRTLQPHNTATFNYIEGTILSEAGPGIAGYYSEPYYNFYPWPPTSDEADKRSILDAYDDLYATLEEEGPFDGILGFSHGGTLLAGFLAYHAKMNPFSEPPVRCAVFISSLPPFHLNEKELPVFDYEGQKRVIDIPTIHIIGREDFVYDHSLRLYEMCNKKSATMILHNKGHEVPRDKKVLAVIGAAFRDLNSKISFY